MNPFWYAFFSLVGGLLALRRVYRKSEEGLDEWRCGPYLLMMVVILLSTISGGIFLSFGLAATLTASFWAYFVPGIISVLVLALLVYDLAARYYTVSRLKWDPKKLRERTDYKARLVVGSLLLSWYALAIGGVFTGTWFAQWWTLPVWSTVVAVLGGFVGAIASALVALLLAKIGNPDLFGGRQSRS